VSHSTHGTGRSIQFRQIPDERGEGVEESKEFKGSEEFELLGNPEQQILCFGGAGYNPATERLTHPVRGSTISFKCS
jgi:hypothetical protein